MSTTIDPSAEIQYKQQSKLPKSLSKQESKAGFWRACAPQKITSTNGKSWKVWLEHLQKRSTPRGFESLCDASSTPLGWGLSEEDLSSDTRQLHSLVTRLEGKSKKLSEDAHDTLVRWQEGTQQLPQSLDFALECLGVAHVLPRIAHLVSRDFWWSLFDSLWQVAQSAKEWRSDAELPPEQGISQQLLAGELPLTLAYLFPEIRPVYKLRNNAQEALSEGLVELLNGGGLVQGSYLAYLRPLLAVWSRCHYLGATFKKKLWSRKAEDQLHQLTTHAIGLSSPQGTSLLAPSHNQRWTPDFLKNALHIANDTADISATRAIFKKKLTASLKDKQVRIVPETSENCEWSGVAYMRTEWQRSAPLLAVDYSTPDLRLELWNGPQRLIAGNWSWETTLDGKRLEPVGSWDESCWFSDEDVDYLEVSIDLVGGARLERQILLAREELFLLLSDNVVDTRGGKLSHRFRLPIDSGIHFQPEEETREGLLSGASQYARVLPLALPEWRTDPRVGQLLESQGKLQLEQEREGRNLACPLLIDLKKSRSSKPCTWRQLTIAQSLEIQPPDVAVGYRAQCGKQQWLIYRSLAEAANRTLLGQNISIECLVARFLAASGEVDELLEIE